MQDIENYIGKLSEKGYQVQRTTEHGRIIRIYTERNRLEVVEEVLKIFPELRRNPRKCTELLFPGKRGRIEVKPRQKAFSAGIQNEVVLFEEIRKKLDKKLPIDICFMDSSGSFLCRGVRNVEQVGSDTKGKKKADLLLRGFRDYRISIKKASAEYWESSDRYAGKKARKILEHLVSESRVELLPLEEKKRLSKEITYPATLEETGVVVFGSDLSGGCVVVQDFVPGCLRETGESSYLLPVRKLYLNPVQVYEDKEDSVWFLIRNDRTRNSRSLGIPGIRVLATYHSRVASRKNIIRLEFPLTSSGDSGTLQPERRTK